MVIVEFSSHGLAAAALFSRSHSKDSGVRQHQYWKADPPYPAADFPLMRRLTVHLLAYS